MGARRRGRWSGALTAAALLASAAGAAAPASADGAPDTGSLPGGVVGGTFDGLGEPTSFHTVADVERDAAGRWLVGANVFSSASAVARYGTDGVLDRSFGDGGYARPTGLSQPRVEMLAELADGRIVAGDATNGLTVFGPDGVSQGRLSAGVVVTDDLQPLPDGRLLMVGDEFGVDVLQAVTVGPPFGNSLVERWTVPVRLPSVGLSRLAIDAAGRIFVTNCSLVVADPRCIVIAYSPSGALDTSFGAGGVLALTNEGVEPFACAVDAAPDGYLVTACGTPAGVLVRTFGPTGRPAPSFTPRLLPGGDVGIRVAVEGTGRAFVATTVEVSASQSNSIVTAFLPDGSVDTSFGSGGAVLAAAGGTATGLRVAAGGGVYAFGLTNALPTRWWLAAFEAPAGPALQPPLVRTARFVPVTPTRVLDTRAGVGRAGGAPPAAGETVLLDLTAVAPSPRSAVTAVVLNLTATEAAAPGFVTAWPSGGGRPTVSNLNVERAGQTVANLAVVPLGADGTVALYTQSGTHLVADVAGWFVAAPTATAGRYVAAPGRIGSSTRGSAPARRPRSRAPAPGSTCGWWVPARCRRAA